MKIQNPTRMPGLRLLCAGVFALVVLTNARADYQGTILTDNPLAYFALDLTVDDGGTATDLSGNGNNSAYYNIYPTTGPTAYLPNAAIFLGSSVQSYVDLSTAANAGSLNFGGPITLEAWVQPSDPGQSLGYILGKGYDNDNNGSETDLRLNGGHYEGGTYNYSVGSKGAGGGTPTTNWTYVVATYDGANWNVYVNARLVAQGADSVGALNVPTPWAIGNGTAGGNGRFFQGNLCQVALYSHALTAAQVLTHFYSAELNAAPESSAPIITAQPQPQSVYPGGSVTFSVASVSAFAVTNQWLKNGSPISGQTNTTLVLTNVQSGDDVNYRVIVGNINGTTNSDSVALSLFTPANLQWSASGNSGIWDTGNSANWINLRDSSQTVFNFGDQVLFDDTANVPTNVIVTGTVASSLITVDSSFNNYTFDNAGTISGAGSLVKKGSSLLTILSVGNFTGPVVISGGTVYAGNNSLAAVSAITVTNGGTLDLGGGAFTGNKPVTISGSGANGIGALYNSYDDYPQESVHVTLAGDASFGAGKRWDLAAGSHLAGPHHLTLDWTGSGYSEWNAPVIGADVPDIVLTNGNFGAKGMSNSFLNPATTFTVSPNCQLYFWDKGDGFNGSIHLLSNAQIQHFGAPGGFNGNKIILETSADFVSYGNTNAEAATPVNSAIILNGVARFEIGDHNLIFTNLISGPGGFVWNNWNHQMVLSASNTFAGPTVLGAGPQVALVGDGSILHSTLIFFGGNDPTVEHMDVTGRSDGTFTLATGQTLAGIGAINGKLTVSPGATLAPAGTNTTIGITAGANRTGTIMANDTVTLSGATTLKLNGSGVNDQVQSATGITYGGTLNLVNISGNPLAAGDSFQIFNAPSYDGSFASITPPTPGAGLAWDTNQLNLGFINVVAGGGPGPVVNRVISSGGNLIFSGSGGTPNANYAVLATTNLAMPDWTAVMTNSFDGTGAFSVTDAISAGTPQQFYRIEQRQ